MLSQNPVSASAVSIPSNIVNFPALAALPAVLVSETPPPRPALANKRSTPLPALTAGAALAHDARNALSSLVLLAGLLEEPGMLPDPHRHYASDLEMLAQSLSSMVERLAGLAGAQTESMSELLPAQRAAKVSASDAIEGCAGMLKALAGSRVSVHVSAEKKLPPLAMGEDALQRVLINLVKNAAEAMPEGGVVRITARLALSRSSPAVLVHVLDNGHGIPAHAIGRIFEPGFSSKRALRSAGEPCGLGLAIVRELVEASGGAVEVASTRRRGTTFELRLPCLHHADTGG